MIRQQSEGHAIILAIHVCFAASIKWLLNITGKERNVNDLFSGSFTSVFHIQLLTN